MKKPLLLILLILTLPLLSFGIDTAPENRSTFDSGSGNVSEPSDLTVPGWGALLGLDQETARILDEEISRTITASWAAGYKVGRVEFEPQVDYWMTKAQSEKARFWDGLIWGLGIGTVTTIGLAAGAMWLHAAVSR